VHQSIRARESLALVVCPGASVRPTGRRRAPREASAAVMGRVRSARVRESAAPAAGTAAGPGARAQFARSVPPRQTPAGGRHSRRT
jgi:hypothetical protein